MTTETTPVGAGESSPAPDGCAHHWVYTAVRDGVDRFCLKCKATEKSRNSKPWVRHNARIDGQKEAK